MPESTTDEQIAKIRHDIEAYVAVDKLEDDGVKFLAYPIKDGKTEHLRARYIHLTAKAREIAYRRLNGELVKNHDILRYLIY